MKAWLTDLRKTALLVAIGMLVQILLWATSPDTAQQFARMKNGLSHPGYAYAAWAFAAIVALPVIATEFGFLVRLHRTPTVARVPDNLRGLAWLASAVTLCLSIWSRQFYFNQAGLSYLKSPVGLMRLVLALLVDLVTVLFLVALAMQEGDEDRAGAADDRMLLRLAKTGTIIWGVILVGIVWATGYTAVYYREMQHQYFQNLQAFVPLSTLMWEKLQQFLQQAIVFVPFFIIHRGFVERRLTRENAAG